MNIDQHFAFMLLLMTSLAACSPKDSADAASPAAECDPAPCGTVGCVPNGSCAPVGAHCTAPETCAPCPVFDAGLHYYKYSPPCTCSQFGSAPTVWSCEHYDYCPSQYFTIYSDPVCQVPYAPPDASADAAGPSACVPDGGKWDYDARLVPGSSSECPPCSPYSDVFTPSCTSLGLVCVYLGSNVGATCTCTPSDGGTSPGEFSCAL